jgi:hypothetical protein
MLIYDRDAGRPVIGLPGTGRELGDFFHRRLRRKKLPFSRASEMPRKTLHENLKNRSVLQTSFEEKEQTGGTSGKLRFSLYVAQHLLART